MKTITKSTNWLIAGLSDEELTAKKALADIAAEIQLKRLDMGLDQKQFAKMMGVSQGMVSRWESGMYNFTITTLVNICEKLDLSFEPQITHKEIAKVIVEETKFISFNFSNYHNDKYCDWIPDRSVYRNNDFNKVGVSA